MSRTVELLLFLTALLTGFTGAISGVRGAEPRQVERAAVSAVAAVAAEAATVARKALIPAAELPTIPAKTEAPRFALVEAAPQDAPRVNESRLE